MPTITAISQQKRDPSRYNISVNGEYAFAMSSNALLVSGLHKGQELTEAELEQVKELAQGNRAYDQALNYLSLRKRSRREIQQYLAKKGEYDVATIEATIEQLERNNFINDADFAAAWIADRNALKPRSKRMLAQELQQKGIGSVDIEQALSEVSDDDQLEQIRKIADKKAARYSDRQKLISYLGSLGYNYDLIKRALSDD